MAKFYFLIVLLSTISIATENKYNYNKKYFNLAEQIGCDMGIVVIGYNRADSFKIVVESLEKNPEANYVPFIFVLDGGPNATQQEHIEIINASNIKYKFIYVHTSNYGCGRTLIDARRFMFEWCKFKKIFFFEDDMIVSPQYIRLTLNLYDYAKKKYNNVGVVQGYNRCFLSQKTKELYYDYIIEPFGSCWGYCMDEDAYFTIADLMNEHEKNHLIAIPADQPNSAVIAKWIKDKILCSFSLNGKNDHRKFLKSRINWEEYCNHFIERLERKNIHRDGQDFEMRLALWKNNLLRLTTFVSRGLYIGEQGVHHNGNHHQLFAYDRLTLFESDNDDYIIQFKENFYIETRKIVFDFSYYQQNFSIARYLDRLVENGYSIKIYINKKIDTFFMYHYLPSFVKNDFFTKNKKYIKITPIDNKKNLKNFLLTRLENKCEYLYIINAKMVDSNQLDFKTLIDSKISLIAHDKNVETKLLKIFDKSRIFMWHETFKLFEQCEKDF